MYTVLSEIMTLEAVSISDNCRKNYEKSSMKKLWKTALESSDCDILGHLNYQHITQGVAALKI